MIHSIIGFLKRQRRPSLKCDSKCRYKRQLRFEHLENRKMLAIAWINQGIPGNDADDFQDVYGAANAVIARQLVNRAIDNWGAVITDFRYDTDNDPATNNTFNLTVVAASISGRGSTSTTFNTNGKATQATITLDDNGQGSGWFFDATPLDDAEFTAVVNSGVNGTEPAFQASFVNIAGGFVDFYRTIVHEIGHAMGLASSSPAFALTGNPWMTLIGDDPNQPGAKLYSFHRDNSQFGVTGTITTDGGRHLYEGNHPNDLMNDGRITPVGSPRETTRQFISDFDAKILADAYGYAVNLPSYTNSAYASLDFQTGTLLVQGGVNSQGEARNESFTITELGANIQVQVMAGANLTTELFPRAAVSQLVIAPNGGTDGIYVAPSLNNIPGFRKDVQYVVSSNQDSANLSDTVGDGFVDQDPAVPGRQTSLRAAIIDARRTPADSSIYVPRGIYNLTISGSGGDEQGDIDIDRHMIIIGSGAGATIIDGSALAVRDRIFETLGTGSLDLSRVTLTGGQALDGGAIRANNNATVGVTELFLREVAIVGNTATGAGGGHGGGVYFEPGANGAVYNSVIANNTGQASGAGGGIYAGGNASLGASVLLGRSVVANNASGDSLGPDLYSVPIASFTSVDGNLLTSTAGSNLAAGGLQANDHVGAVNYVVTSVVDSFDTDTRGLSIREAIQQANALAGQQTMWLPAWNFMLTRDRVNYDGNGPIDKTDMDIAFGDLDIHQSLTIRGSGIAGATIVRWRPELASDAVFDLLGDYNGNGISSADNGNVGSEDYTVWQDSLGATGENLRADGDDDGDVDQADRTVWLTHWGNTLTLTKVTVA
jgi:hypothetical protein